MYKAVQFEVDPCSQDNLEILIALLDDAGFEGIAEEGEGIAAYCNEQDFEEGQLIRIRDTLQTIQCNVSWNISDIPEQNWNRVWESHFDPVIIEPHCAIRAPFHPHFPAVEFEITIEPKMSFGTGHHQTTQLILKYMFTLDFRDRKVLDMGCGTGVLAIVAEKLGASAVTAIDIDSWAFENACENIERNRCKAITTLQGSAEIIPDRKYDIILANINRNILLEQIPVYADHLASDGLLVVSGLLGEDEPVILDSAKEAGLLPAGSGCLEQWCMLVFRC